MQFTKPELLFIVVTVVFIIVVFMSQKSPRRDPSKLNMKKTSKARSSETGLAKKTSRRNEAGALNYIFDFEGRSWDAYEVLGLPAGSSLGQVKQAYERVPKTSLSKKAFDELCAHLYS